MGQGYNSFLGFAEESTWGTPVTPATSFIELVEGGDRLEVTEPLLISAGVNEISTHKTRKVRRGGIVAGGEFEFEVPYRGAEKVFKHGFGTVADAVVEAGVAWSHIYTIAAALPAGLTVEDMKDGPSSTESLFFEGSRVDFLEFNVEQDGFWRCVAGVVAEDAAWGAKSTVSLATAPLANFYDDGTGAGVTWNAAAIPVTNFRARIENGLKRDRRKFGVRQILQPVRNRSVLVTASFRAEFESLVMFNDFRAATSRVLEAKSLGDLIGASATNRYELALTLPVGVLTKATPKVTDRGIVYADCECQGFWDGTNRELKLKMVNDLAAA